tara:strand:- start:165 stop:551 length:387 start_codon:yes stop_codon:yes gene_type:complete
MNVPDWAIQGAVSIIASLGAYSIMNTVKKNEEKSDLADDKTDKKFEGMLNVLKADIDKNDKTVWKEIKSLLNMFRENDRELYKLVGLLEKMLEYQRGRSDGERDLKSENNIIELITLFKDKERENAKN